MAVSEKKRFVVGKFFSGRHMLEQVVVKVQAGWVTAITEAKGAAVEVEMMAPAFIDLQLYGAEGRLFSVFPDTETLHAIRRSCEAGGASHFQPTVATNTPSVMSACIRAIRSYWKEGGEGCIGLHLEGPWIHPQKRGAHLEAHITRGTRAAVETLLEEGRDVISMITLAPECCDAGVIDLLRSAGIIVSAGHSNASYEEASQSFNQGITTATHLYNAMSSLQHRAPGMVGAIMDHTAVRASIIPDGHHVDAAAIRVAKKIMGERLFMITDAVTDTDQGPYQHRRSGNKFESGGTLSGSMINMLEGVLHLIKVVGISEEEALRMASLYPANVMGKEGLTGTIEVGKPFRAVWMTKQMELVNIFRGNEWR